MTYDITLYPRRPGQDWAEAIDAAEADDETLAADEGALATGVDTFRRIEGRLRDVLDGPLESWTAEETGGDVYGELTATETGIAVELFDRSAEVSFTDTDGEGEERDELHRQVLRTVEVVAKETGYVAYDPQTGDAFDGVIRDASTLPADGIPADGTGMPEDGTAQPDGSQGGTDPVTDRPDPRRNPASLRRRGWIYLLLGAVLVALAGRQFGDGGGGIFTIVLMVIGVLDVLGGLFLLSVAKRMADSSPVEGQTPDP